LLDSVTREVRALIADASSNATQPVFSPDGRWIAYSSNTSGRYQIWTRSFPELAKATRVSLNGGTDPRWAATGREIFYLSGACRGNTSASMDTRSASGAAGNCPSTRDVQQLRLCFQLGGHRVVERQAPTVDPVMPAHAVSIVRSRIRSLTTGDGAGISHRLRIIWPATVTLFAIADVSGKGIAASSAAKCQGQKSDAGALVGSWHRQPTANQSRVDDGELLRPARRRCDTMPGERPGDPE
jgi:hypothetical protein